MSHFGSSDWPDRFGTVAKASTDGASLVYAASATTLGTTEGQDLLTYTVPAGGTGLYMLATDIHVVVVTAAGTSQTMLFQVAYNNGTAQAVVDIGEVSGGGSATVAPLDVQTAAGVEIGQMGIIRAEAGTDIAIQSSTVVVGTITAVGTADLDMAIIRLA